MLRINWNHLKNVCERIKRENKFDDDSQVIFHITPGNKSEPIPFGEFLAFFWRLHEKSTMISKVVVVDAKTSKVLYKHAPTAVAKEVKPAEGDGASITNWNKFPEPKKVALLEILLAQIESQDDE